MSCEGPGFDGFHSAVDDQTKEPTYAEAFPPLPMSAVDAEPFLPSPASTPGGNQWSKKMSLRSTTTTQVCGRVEFIVTFIVGGAATTSIVAGPEVCL